MHVLAHDQNDTFTIAALVPAKQKESIAVFIVLIPPMKLIHELDACN